jgi:hypothetical protein
MAAVRLRVILRTVITESRPPDLGLQQPRSTAFPIDRRAGAVGPDSVNQPADRLPRDQSPGGTEGRAHGLLRRGYCRAHWGLRLHACRSDQS